jgi:hypothetical protein
MDHLCQKRRAQCERSKETYAEGYALHPIEASGNAARMVDQGTVTSPKLVQLSVARQFRYSPPSVARARRRSGWYPCPKRHGMDPGGCRLGTGACRSPLR